MVEETKEEKEIVQQAKVNKMSLTRKIVITIFFFLSVLLIYIKWTNPDFQIKYLLIIFAVMIILALGFYYGFDFFKKYKDLKNKLTSSKDLPDPATPEELMAIVEDTLRSPQFQNHVKRWIGYNQETVNRNLIYNFEIEPLYADNGKDRVNIIVNAHFPNRLPTVRFAMNVREQHRAINSASTDPEPPAETEETESINNLTGTTIKVKKRKPTIKKEEEKKEVDLA